MVNSQPPSPVSSRIESSFVLPKKRVVYTSDEDDEQPEAGPSYTPPKATKLKSTKYFLSDAERSSDSDASIGSLREFIVPDSDVSDGSVSGTEAILLWSPPGKVGRRPEIIELSSDDDEDDLPIPISKPRPKHPPTHTPSKPSSRTPRSRSWQKDKHILVDSLIKELNGSVFENKLEVNVVWSSRLLTTAGRASQKGCKIELAEKVIEDEDRLNATVAHEMCHLAVWLISKAKEGPHGKTFKAWGRKVMQARPDIEVTTTHNYVIEYKYEWRCVKEDCGVVYRRHSKSIDPEKHRCGKCKSPLLPLFQQKSTPFQIFLKENMKRVKAEMPGKTHGEVMREMSRRWENVKFTKGVRVEVDETVIALDGLTL